MSPSPKKKIKLDTKARNRFTIAQKLEILEMKERGDSFSKIASTKNTNESTIRGIWKKKDEIRSQGAATSKFHAETFTKQRSTTMTEMERLLFVWIEDCDQRNVPISLQEMKFKATSLFDMAKNKLPKPLTEKQFNEKFEASNGWWHRFSKRMNLSSVKLLGESGSADHEAAKKYPETLRKIIEEGGYTEDQIFNVDEAGIWWKMPPTRTIKTKTQGQAAGLKLPKSRSTVLFGGNASGDLKLKPLFIHTSENPRSMNKVNKLKLPVHWSANKKAWMTSALFENWFKYHFIPAVKFYCRRKNLDFKILLLVDNCPAHPDLSHVDPNVRVEFLPPNTTSLIQPMDQGVIATVKALYRKITFSKAHETHDTLADFFKEFTIMDAVKNLGDAWSQVTAKNMRGVWQPLLKRPEQNDYKPPVEEIIEDIVKLGNELGIDLESKDIKEGLEFDNKDISNEELFELEQARAFEEEDEEEADNVVEMPTKISSNELGRLISKANELCDLISEIDPISERKFKVKKDIQEAVKCYQEEIKQKAKKQKTIGEFFKKSGQ